MTGKIQRLLPDKGFGFIRSSNKEYFFHRSSLRGWNWNELVDDVLSKGEGHVDVTFEVEPSEKGPRAADVRPLED